MATVTTVVPRTRRGVELALLVFAVGIVLVAYANVGLAVDGELPPSMLSYGIGLIVLVGSVHLMLRWKASYADPVMLPIATLLNGLGLVMIHRLDLAEDRSGGGMAARQLIWMTVGVAICLLILYFVRDHRTLQRYTFTAMAAGLVLLLLPLVPGLGKNINGSRIWIGVGSLSFQPGELAKILLAMFFAGYLVRTRDSLALVGRKVLGSRAAAGPRPRPDHRGLAGQPRGADLRARPRLVPAVLRALRGDAVRRHRAQELDRHRSAAVRRRRRTSPT